MKIWQTALMYKTRLVLKNSMNRNTCAAYSSCWNMIRGHPSKTSNNYTFPWI